DRQGITQRHGTDAVSLPKYASFGRFRMSENGLFVREGNNQAEFISAAFEVIGRVRDPNGEGWARLLGWSDDDNREHTFPVPDAGLHGDPAALCANLATRGLKIATGRAARAQLIAYLNEVSVSTRVTIVERTGWHEVNKSAIFAIPGNAFGSVANETII